VLGHVGVDARGDLVIDGADRLHGHAAALHDGDGQIGEALRVRDLGRALERAADVRHEEAGAASGVVSAAYQVGGALGLAIITTLSTSRTADALAGGAARSDALVQGFQRGLLIAAVFAAINIVVALPSPQLRPSSEQLGEAAAAA
jgi:hypothetical protein